MQRRQMIVREYLSRTRDEDFIYGSTDCCKWIAGFVEAMTGIDHTIGLTYDEASSGDVIRGLGGFEAVATRALGEPIAPDDAKTGDIALVHLAILGFTYVLVAGPRGWGRRAPRGLIQIPRRRWQMAWAVPCLR